MKKQYFKSAENYLDHLCNVISNRHPGSVGNQQATAWAAEILRKFNWRVTSQPFPCIDWRNGDSFLKTPKSSFKVKTGPYSLPFAGKAELIQISRLKELEEAQLDGKILLLTGEIAAGQLFPKNFPFYNPDEHKKIYQILEEKKPAAIIAATGKNPEVAGSLYPFPMFEDGDFDIPNAYLKDTEGQKLKKFAGQKIEVVIDSERIPSEGENIIASKGNSRKKIVLTAHIDTKKNTAGALDNASGIVTLLLAAEMLKDYDGEQQIEIALLNGEDYYQASGELKYIADLQDKWDEIDLCINIDAAGNVGHKIAISEYSCSDRIKARINKMVKQKPDLILGDPWYMGDHMIFVQQNVPSLAICSENMLDLCRDITHTPADDVSLVDSKLLVETAEFMVDFINTM
jgi:aminopeptidase YwaD